MSHGNQFLMCWLSNFLQWWILYHCPSSAADLPVSQQLYHLCQQAGKSEVLATKACATGESDEPVSR